jgi:hypothetical protein
MTAIAVSSTLRPVRILALRRTWRGLSLLSDMQSPSLDSKTLIQETDPKNRSKRLPNPGVSPRAGLRFDRQRDFGGVPLISATTPATQFTAA